MRCWDNGVYIFEKKKENISCNTQRRRDDLPFAVVVVVGKTVIVTQGYMYSQRQMLRPLPKVLICFQEGRKEAEEEEIKTQE